MDVGKQKFQDQLSREILLGQQLRLAVVAGVMSFCAIFLMAEFIRVEWTHGERHPPVIVIFVATLMTIYQLLVRRYVRGRLRQDRRKDVVLCSNIVFAKEER